MQQRRYRPGDVLDDYCPRERRITDHAIVAMIDDNIKQTRCCVCDAEHEFKDGKVPPQRRKKPQAALFTQVLEGLQGSQAARLHHADAEGDPDSVVTLAETGAELVATVAALPATPPAHVEGNGHGSTPEVDLLVAQHTVATAVSEPVVQEDGAPARDEGPVRRSLIRATLPRPEGQPVATRAMPEFTIRQPSNGRASRHGGRRRGAHQHQGQGMQGPMRFGRG